MPGKIVTVGELKAGDQVAERDGYLLTVFEVVRQTEKTVTLRLGSDFSPMRELHSDGPGIIQTFRKTTRVQTVRTRPAGQDLAESLAHR